MSARFRLHRMMGVAAATPLALCCAATAQPELYFSEYQFQAPRMNAMGLDGSNPRLLFAPPAAMWLPLGMSFRVDTQQVVWIDSAGTSEVVSANLDGSGQAAAVVPGFCKGLSLDAQARAYFGSNNTVQRINADGSGLVTIFTSTSTDPVGAPRVDATNGHVYVPADGAILRMNLDGTNIKTVATGMSQPRAIGLDIAGGYIYWIDADTHSDHVGRARLDGSDFTVLVDHTPNVVQSPGLIDLVVDPVSGFLFYADELTGQILRSDLEGAGLAVIYTSPTGPTPSGMVLSTGEPAQPLLDCDGNGVADDIDIANGAPDCDNNGFLDSCQAEPCPNRTFLVDQGSNAAHTQGRALGVPSQWQVFQPFDVPAGETWSIAELAIDGYTSNYADGSGLTVRLFPDDGTGTRPDETTELGATALNLRFNTNHENWVYAPLSVSLDEGRYWVRLEGNDPTVYGASINHGFSGLASLSRGSSGNFTSPASPIALRLVQGGSCPADWNEDDAVNSGDISAFLTSWLASVQDGTLDADFNGDNAVNSGDISAFLTAWLDAVANGC